MDRRNLIQSPRRQHRRITSMSAPALFTEQEAAQALKVCTRTLRKARQDGALSFVRIGRNVRYSEADLAQFIERSRECLSTSAPARRSGSTRSPSTVFDFEEVRAARGSAKRGS
ncbi:MAG: helix-turn-helix domain-containing protein [Pseudomonadota bacterium]|nr:helix-turn-helix domain-containing protein [Pseudomonadota bacterium]